MAQQVTEVGLKGSDRLKILGCPRIAMSNAGKPWQLGTQRCRHTGDLRHSGRLWELNPDYA